MQHGNWAMDSSLGKVRCVLGTQRLLVELGSIVCSKLVVDGVVAEIHNI